MTSLRKQAHFWDKVSVHARPLDEVPALIKSLLAPQAIRGRDVLDAGCGAGDHSAVFSQLGAATIDACDISVASLRLARARVPKARFTCASLDRLPYRSDSFDVIWNWGVLHYVPDPDTALREVARVMRPGGVAVIHTLRRGFWARLERASARLLSKTPHRIQPIILSIAEYLVHLVSRLTIRHRPDRRTSKTVRQKLRERLFVPCRVETFDARQIARTLGPLVELREVFPPTDDLFNRQMSISVIAQKRLDRHATRSGQRTEMFGTLNSR
jgi:ubiquinone/menaquinone biosynthesis C-methylase UbiE